MHGLSFPWKRTVTFFSEVWVTLGYLPKSPGCCLTLRAAEYRETKIL